MGQNGKATMTKARPSKNNLSQRETRESIHQSNTTDHSKIVSEDDKAEALVRLLEEGTTRKEKEESRRDRKSTKDRRNRRRSHSRSRTKRSSKSREHRSRHSHRSREHRRHRSQSPHRKKGQSRSPSTSSSNSIQYGGYIPRRRTVNQATGFDKSKGGFQSNAMQDLGRLQQGFSPLPCPTRQVYVGNLVPGLVSDMALRQLFNSALSAAYPSGGRPGTEPVVSVSMHSDGRYAFVELRSPEMATAALQLSGQVQLFGQSITVGRPSGYVDPGKAAAAAQAAAAALAAFNKGEVSAQQTFGSVGVQPPQSIGQMILNTTIGSPASAFISIEGLVDLKMLSSNKAYAEIVKSLRNECVKYGPVIQLKIPRPADQAMAKVLFNTGFYGKAFVQYADVAAAMRAKEGLMSMATGDKNLAINYVSQEVFSAIL